MLFDRDGTLVVDVPYCADPALVTPVSTAPAALALLRAAGIPVGVVSNQSGIARGLLDREQVDAVNRRVDDLLGPFDVWQVCPHGPDDGCACRKPQPGGRYAAGRGEARSLRGRSAGRQSEVVARPSDCDPCHLQIVTRCSSRDGE